MLFIPRFTNSPERADLVSEYYRAHVEWLKERVWIVGANKDEVEDLFRTDPFRVNGLRQEYEILYCCKAFPDKTVSV